MDAIVIGAGPNGLVAANLLIDRGWEVLVVEEQPEPGGAVKTAELTIPGFRHDVYSAFYPLAVASRAMRGLELERYGLRWSHAPIPVAHATPDGAVCLWRDVDRTAADLDASNPGDGDGWRALFGLWARTGGAFVDALLAPFPPIRHALRLGLNLRRELATLARLAALPVRRLSDESFASDRPGLLLAGNALHADLTPEMPLSALIGFLLCGMAHEFGYPAPRGGAGKLTDALVDRFEAKGGRILCSARVVEIVVRGGRAAGVRLQDGSVEEAGNVLADVSAPALYSSLLPNDAVPSHAREAIRRFHQDSATVKVDWALSRPVPWGDDSLSGAGTIHTGDDMDHLTIATTQLARGVIPGRPPLVIGQMNAADPSRSPEGTATLWAYTHVPQRVKDDGGGTLSGSWDKTEKEDFADRIQAEIERHAPGFASTIRARHVLGPADLEAGDANIVGGATNGGTAQLHQQAIFRPIPGRGGPRTPVRNLYLASASAHPGGGVHGACGANAAHAALTDARWRAGTRIAAVGLAAGLGARAAARKTPRS